MPKAELLAAERRSDAIRLIAMARTKLTGDSEEMAAIYLDHALAALRDIESEAAERGSDD